MSSSPSSWTPSETHSTFSNPLIQSPNDSRSYRLIKLPNGLQAILVSDPETDKAAASLSVGVGHLSDPEERPGLAHFCEHLLFMGTEQFPKENEYGEFVEQNGGRTNAYTATNNTNYYFSVSSPSLFPALLRFSTFFHSPLFSPSCTAREILAVDSENKKNLQNDMWRIFQLDKGLSVEGKRWGKFGTGNWESLMRSPRREEGKKGDEKEDGKEAEEDGGEAGREVRRILLDWYARHYSANRMTLAVYGKESLDELAEMVSKLFAPVPNRNLPPLYDETSAVPALSSPWGSAQEGSTIFVKSVMDLRAVEMRWVIPSQTFSYKRKTVRLLTHWLGHEGFGSIYSVLKKKGWITQLSSSRSSGDLDEGFDFLRIGMVVTPEGLENYTSIIRTINAYLTSITSSPSLPSYHFDELKNIASTSFRFAEKTPAEGYVTSLAEILAKPYAREDILSASTLMYGSWDAETQSAVRELVSEYLTPEKARVTVMLRDDWARLRGADGKVLWERGEDDVKWEKEKWYGTQYVVLPTRLEGEGARVVEGLELPAPNEFIPTRFEVEKKEVAEPLKRPLKIRETSLSTLWYKKDDQFWVPKALFTLFIRSPLTSVTPRNGVMSRLFTELLTDALAERTYDADLAGLSHHVSSQMQGIRVSVGGYSDRLSVLLQTILSEMKTFRVDPERLGVYKEQLRQEWQNTLLEQPSYLSEVRAAHIVRERAWSEQEKIDELSTITAEELQNHITSLLSRTFTEALIHGNVSKDDAIVTMKQAEEVLGSRSLTQSERLSMRSHILPVGANFVYDASVPNKDDVNSALTYYCQIGDPTDRTLSSTLQLLCQLIREPSFNQLRTKEQLGYLVWSGYWAFPGTMGFRLTIQSERSPVYLETRVEAFFEDFRALLGAMDEEEFERGRQSLIDKKLTKLKNLHEESQRFVGHIDDGYFDFIKREAEVEIIRKLTKDDVAKFFAEYIHQDSPTRAKLSVHLCSQQTPSPRVSIKAADVLMHLFKDAGVPVKENEYTAASSLQLSVVLHQKTWRDYFDKEDTTFDRKIAADLIEMIPKIAKQYPVAEKGAAGATGEPKLREGAVYVDSIPALKRRLMLGPAAIPVESYSDLTGSKL